MDKTIYYAAVVHGKDDIIKECDIVPGQARQLALVVLDKVENETKKQSFLHEEMSVHYVSKASEEFNNNNNNSNICPDGVTFIVVTKRDVERRMPFLFLLQLERTFDSKYVPEIRSDISELKENNTLLPEMRQLIKTCESGENDATGLAKSEIEQVKNIMVENVERILERGERINLLISKTDRMNNNALAFRRRTVAVRRSMWWKNIKLCVLLIVVAVFVVYLLMAFVCGLTFDECLRGPEPKPNPELEPPPPDDIKFL